MSTYYVDYIIKRKCTTFVVLTGRLVVCWFGIDIVWFCVGLGGDTLKELALSHIIIGEKVKKIEQIFVRMPLIFMHSFKKGCPFHSMNDLELAFICRCWTNFLV